MGLGGWVRNRADGGVEAVFEGEEEAVQTMVEWCRRGSEPARVTSVETAEEMPTNEHGFRVL